MVRLTAELIPWPDFHYPATCCQQLLHQVAYPSLHPGVVVHLGAMAYTGVKNATTQPQLIRNPERGEQRCFSPLIVVFWAVGPSALPCAGAAPPQRPPPRPSLTDRVPSSQRVGWRAWPWLYTSCVTKNLNGSRDDWLVNYCGFAVTQKLRSGHRCARPKGGKWAGPCTVRADHTEPLEQSGLRAFWHGRS